MNSAIVGMSAAAVYGVSPAAPTPTGAVAEAPAWTGAVCQFPVVAAAVAPPIGVAAAAVAAAALVGADAGAAAGGWAAGVPRMAAPSATSCLGWLSMASGRPKAADSISLTSGIRDDPPTSTIADRSPGSTPAGSSTRRVAATVSAIAGRSMSSNSARLSRTDVLIPGSATGTTVSVLNDSTSLASTQSRRSRASPTVVAGSVSSRFWTSGPSVVRTWRNTASSKSIPPRCSTPSGGPASRNPGAVAQEDGGVERAAAEVVDRDLLALGHPVARRVGDRRSLGLGARLDVAQAGELDRLPQEVALERAPVGRVRHAHVLGRAALPLGGDADHPGQQPGRQRLRRERRPADHERNRVADPPLELPHHPRRLRRALLLGGLADDDLAVGAHEHHRRHLHGPDAQSEHLHPAVDVDRRSRIGGAQIDTQPVTHAPPPEPISDGKAVVSGPDTSKSVRCVFGTGGCGVTAGSTRRRCRPRRASRSGAGRSRPRS